MFLYFRMVLCAALTLSLSICLLSSYLQRSFNTVQMIPSFTLPHLNSSPLRSSLSLLPLSSLHFPSLIFSPTSIPPIPLSSRLISQRISGRHLHDEQLRHGGFPTGTRLRDVRSASTVRNGLPVYLTQAPYRQCCLFLAAHTCTRTDCPID
jgi:hypothetical protein